jgi:hypothetical protein
MKPATADVTCPALPSDRRPGTTPILSGSLSRIFLGIWTDQYGGRLETRRAGVRHRRSDPLTD